MRFKLILKSLFGHFIDVQPSVITHLGIKMSWRKRIRTIDSFFSSNRSQIDQRNKNTEEEHCINEEETDGAQMKPQSFQKTWLRDHMLLGYEKEAM